MVNLSLLKSSKLKKSVQRIIQSYSEDPEIKAVGKALKTKMKEKKESTLPR